MYVTGTFLTCAYIDMLSCGGEKLFIDSFRYTRSFPFFCLFFFFCFLIYCFFSFLLLSYLPLFCLSLWLRLYCDSMLLLIVLFLIRIIFYYTVLSKCEISHGRKLSIHIFFVVYLMNQVYINLLFALSNLNLRISVCFSLNKLFERTKLEK